MITIRDVARSAGVSVSTVSRALNGYVDVSEKTRKRIQDTVKELGYIPNQSAQILSSKSRKNAALFISGIANEDRLDEFTGNLIRGVYDYMNQRGETIAIYGINSRMQEEKSLETMCHEYSLSGVMLMGLQVQDAYLREAAELDVPCVSIDTVVNSSEATVITTDDARAFEEITDYVLDRGHRKLVLLRGRENAQVTCLRQEGFEKALSKHGLHIGEMTVLSCEFLEEKAYQEAKNYIHTYQKTQATAFICMSDLMALGVCRAVMDEGYHIPEDFSVTGFDGLHILEHIRPLITTIDQDITQKGYQGVKILMDMVEGGHTASKIYVPHRLVERDSVRDLRI